jgi:hypothetical protein
MIASSTGKSSARFGWREQIITLAVTLLAAAIVYAVRAPSKWLTAIFITVVTFVGVISYFRNRWRSRRFWQIIVAALLVHLVLVWVVFSVVLSGIQGVGFLVCVPVIYFEAYIIYRCVLVLDEEISHTNRRDRNYSSR